MKGGTSMTDAQHGWRAVTLYSWQADHLIEEETGDPTYEWYDAVTDFDMQQTNQAENPVSLIRAMIFNMEHTVENGEAQGCKLLSITISLMQVPIHRSDKKRADRSAKRP